PELALFSFGFLVPLLWATLSGGPWKVRRIAVVLAKIGLAMGAAPVGYQIFRMGYFAAIVPNTAIAKSAFGSNWQQGWHYVEHFFGLYKIWIPLSLVVFFLGRIVVRNVRAGDWLRLVTYLVPVFCGLGHCVYIVKVGG